MWRKNNGEAKPQPAASKTPASAPAKSPEPPLSASQPAAIPAISTTSHPAATQPKPAAPVEAATPLVASMPATSLRPPAPSGAGFISAGLKIKGEITGTSDLTIDGETQGKVRITTGRVTVGPNGCVIADIDAPEIVVLGTVRGNLKATESVRLGATSQVEGSVLTPRISIEDGATLHGTVEMARPGQMSQWPKTELPGGHSSTEPKHESAAKAHAVHAGAASTSNGSSAATET
jgi:cytoskeletal protein CcmA (bactofilin family)